jgi:glycosyltransferase involved in cell wall biosynthesis
MPDIIHIVEPTLSNEAGHCLSLVNAIAQASPDIRIILWANRSAAFTFTSGNVTVKKYFFRRIRKIQCLFLYRKLLKTQQKILTSTASRLDLSTFNLAAKGMFAESKIPENRVYFYFHWLNTSAKKLAKLKEIAQNQPNLVILGTTPTALKAFKNAGFTHTHVAPYPHAASVISSSPQPFSNVLFAGAARQDKGFTQVVNLVEYAATKKLNMPFLIQCSAEHFSKYDAVTKADVARLKKTTYPYLTISAETLNTQQYAAHFAGSICIQLYNTKDFADRVSGVTLDALAAGSPVLTLADTWMARQVQQFNAGKVLNTTEPEAIVVALNEMIANYAIYSKNARSAGQSLQQAHQAQQLTQLLLAST